MASSAINVGTLRAVLTADTAQWTAGFRTASAEHQKFGQKVKATNDSIAMQNKRASDAMIAAMSAAGKANSASAKMIAGMSQAGRQAAAAQAAAAQAAAASQAAAARAALGFTGRLKEMGSEAVASAKSSGLLNSSIGKLAIGFGSLAIIGKVVGWLGGLAVGAVDAAGNLVDLNEKTGLSIKALQQMQSVAEQTGSTLESFSSAAIKLGVRVEAGSKPVEKAVEVLGLSLKTLQGLKPEDQFRAIADALGKIEDPQKRNELALRLFGKSFADVMPAIVEGYGKMADAAKVSGDAQVKALDAAGDAWTRFKNDASKATIGFLGNLALIAEGVKALSFPDKLRLAFQASIHGASLPQILGLLANVGAATAAAGEQTKKFIGPTLDAGKAQETYSQQLAKVRAELAALTPEQRKEIAAAQQLGIDADILEDKYGLTAGALRILASATKDSTDAAKDSAKTVKELAEQYAAYQKVVQEVTRDVHALAVANAEAMAEAGAKKATGTADQMLGAFNRRTEAERDAADTSKNIEEQRAEFAIEQAKRSGASWQQIFAMEKDLADARLKRTIDQAQLEFEIRTAWIDRTTEFGEAEYQALQRAHDLAVQEMVERHQQAETSKRQELAKTHSFWLQTLESVKGAINSIAQSASDNFIDALFSFDKNEEQRKRLTETAADARKHYEEISAASDKAAGKVEASRQRMVDAQKAFDDAKARKAPAEELQRLSALAVQARMTYEGIAKAGTDSAEDIQDAFDKMREAEDAANQGFASRWKQFCDGMKQTFVGILKDMLGSFTRTFVGGLINALSGKKGAFSTAFSGFLGGGGGLLGGGPGGGGLLGGLLGGGGSAAASGLFAAGGASAGLASGAAIDATTAGLAGGGAAGGGAGAAITGLLTNPITIGVGAGLALTWAIWKKGLFRGGWEGIEGNRRRDQFQAQFGGPGTGPTSGFQKIAEFLTAKTGESGGGRIFRDLQSGDKDRFESAEQTIAAMWNQANKNKPVQTFLFGGMVRGLGAIPAVLHGGEGVLSRTGMTSVGGPEVLKALNAGRAPSSTFVHFSPTIVAWDGGDVRRAMPHLIREFKEAIVLNKGGLGAAVSEA